MRSALFISIGIPLVILTALPMLPFPARASGLSSSSLIGFSLAANPDSISLAVGTKTNVTIIVSSQDLSGAVNLAVGVSSSSGLTATLSPSTVLVLPGGTANSILSIDATGAQPGVYDVNVTGSSLAAPSQATTVVANVTTTASTPPVNPPSGSTPPTGTSPPSGPSSSSSSGPSTGGTSPTISGQSPRGPIDPKGENPSPISDPLTFLIAGNLLAAIATAAALSSLHKRKRQTSLSSWQ